MFMYGFIKIFCFFKSIRKFSGRMAACDNSFRRNFLSSYKWYLRSKSLFHGLVFEAITAWKMSKYGVTSGPHFPTFGMNTERYEASLCIQSECGKIRTRNHSIFGHFPRRRTNFVNKSSWCNNKDSVRLGPKT